MTAPALTQAETSEIYVSDETARAEYIAAARSAAWRRRLLPAGAAILLLVLWELAVIIFHVRPFIAPAPTAVAATLYAKFGLLIGNLVPTADRSGRRIHHRQRGRDRDRNRRCLSAHRRGGVLPDRGDGSHHSGHGLRADPCAPAWQRAQRQSRDRRAHLLLPDPGQHDARPARRQPAANGAMRILSASPSEIFFKLRLKCSRPICSRRSRSPRRLRSSARSSANGSARRPASARSSFRRPTISNSPLLYATIVVGSAFSAAFFGVISWLESRFLKWNVAQTG